jgi:hypothetical protein
MPENKNVPGGKPARPAGPEKKSWQEQLAAIKTSGVTRAKLAGSGWGADTAANAGEIGKRAVVRVRALAGKVFHGRGGIERGLIVGGMVVGLVALAYLVGIPQWMKQRRENRQWTVVNNLTPERLLKRCGKPVSDQTREIYPVIARDIRYESAPSGTVVLKFSRTAEETSDWVFMSMQDSASGATYDTPVAKITALGCLDSSK